MKTFLNLMLAGFIILISACTSNSQSNMTSGDPDGQGKDDKYIGIWADEMSGDYEYRMSEEEWKERLGKDEYQVLRQAGTEARYSSPLNKIKEAGVFYSAATGQPLFRTEHKFESGTGWPSFYRPIREEAVVLKEDSSYGMTRIEVLDSSSGSHLGHVFPDGPKPTGLRYCMNGDAMLFVAEGEEPPAIVREYLEKHPEENPDI